MRNIVLAKLNKLDSANSLKEGLGTYVLPLDARVEWNENDRVFIPPHLLKTADEQLYVYFDLEQYPFFQKIKEAISDRKGVLRFRRMVDDDEREHIIANDLFVISTVLGELRKIHIKRTNQSIQPYHVIVTAQFHDRAMAHLEYTFSKGERIELEWSGIKKIIEFDSEEMRPIYPKGYTSLPLGYSVESIIETAHQVDLDLLSKLKVYAEMIEGGGQ
ncbi:hypothetical protein [Bacillus sp. FJAT-50079]|uniref:hypothetical protein n=1 Tax=Bacillus sp. FJAT-50079 TaxID=2833577 RepID=UPI001BC99A2A|nr:hypothetical protein [Bacillus sp. FJAT-50079]MBS4208188.1 hypothetical protein [Bacillus sp. FJAT-50079]